MLTTFFVEIHSGEELSITHNTQLIIDWCVRNNYSAWYLKDKVQLTLDVIKDRGRYHALLIPKHKPFPDYLMNIKENDNLSTTY